MNPVSSAQNNAGSSEVIQLLFRRRLCRRISHYVLLRPPHANAIFVRLLDHKRAFSGLQARFQVVPWNEAAATAHQSGESPLAPPYGEHKKRQVEVVCANSVDRRAECNGAAQPIVAA